MKYSFHPHQTRSAYETIARLFPMTRSKELQGLDALFEMLEQMNLESACNWGKTLGIAELDMLCRHFNRTRRSRVVLAIAVLLASRGDRRCAQVVHYFFLLNPPPEEWAHFVIYWKKLKMENLTAANLPWLSLFLEQEPLPFAIDFVKDALASGKLTTHTLVGNFTHRLPLFMMLIDFLFADGAKWLKDLKPDLAGELAMGYLQTGSFSRVKTFLQYYPSEGWTEDFIQTLYQTKGPPNSHENPFYASLEKGTLWSIRKYLFTAQLEGMAARRRNLWERWLHHCSEWNNIQEVPHIFIHPFKIIEEPDRTLVFLQEEPLKVIEIFEVNSFWEKQMENLLSEYIQWGAG